MAARAVPKRTASTSSRPAPGQSRQGAFDGGAGDVLAAVVVGTSRAKASAAVRGQNRQ